MMEYEEIWGRQEWVIGDGLQIRGSDEAEEFGGEVWPGAFVLADYLRECELVEVRDRKVIELGCGCGAAGLVAASLGADVILTDVCEKNLEVARRNARENDLKVTAVRLDWRVTSNDLPEVDLVIASDVVYAPSLVAPLLSVLREIKHKTLIVSNDERSNNQRQFGRLLESCDFKKINEIRRDNVLLQQFERLQQPHKLRCDGDFYEDDSDGLGGCVWPAAQVLAEVCPRGMKNVLELGAGCGFVGLSAASHSERVVISDEIVGVAALNARRAKNVELRVIVWGQEQDDDETFDLVLGAELLQYRDPHLPTEIRRRLAPKPNNNNSSRDRGGGIALLTAPPCDAFDDASRARCCDCATHFFLRKACDEENLVLVKTTRVPLVEDTKNSVLGDGSSQTLILELTLSSSPLKL